MDVNLFRIPGTRTAELLEQGRLVKITVYDHRHPVATWRLDCERERCRRPFEAIHAGRRYCSDECRLATKRERDRNRQRARREAAS
jgi:hypothetical protein